MLKQEKLESTNSTKSGAHHNFAKIQENKHTPEDLSFDGRKIHGILKCNR